MCNGQFFNKGPKEAWDYFDERASNNQTWELSSSDRPRASGKFILNEGGDEDLRVKIAKLTQKLEDRNTKKVHEVSSHVKMRKLCDEVGNAMNYCPTIPIFKEVLNGGEQASVNALNLL